MLHKLKDQLLMLEKELRRVGNYVADKIRVVFSESDDNDNLQIALEDEIAASRREIRIALYRFNSQRLVSALIRWMAQDSTRRVRVLLDIGCRDQVDKPYAKALASLVRSKAMVRFVRVGTDGGDAHPGHGPVFHHKYAIFDDTRVAIGSYNWTAEGDRSNYEALALIYLPELAQKFIDRFESACGVHDGDAR